MYAYVLTNSSVFLFTFMQYPRGYESVCMYSIHVYECVLPRLSTGLRKALLLQAHGVCDAPFAARGRCERLVGQAQQIPFHNVAKDPAHSQHAWFALKGAIVSGHHCPRDRLILHIVYTVWSYHYHNKYVLVSEATDLDCQPDLWVQKGWWDTEKLARVDVSDDVTTVGKEFPLILHGVAQGDISAIWCREIKFHIR